jgi:hypothetical protein
VSLQQLREKLEKGFYVDNLYEMARLCKSLALDAINPAPFFVMRSIFLGIARDWEDRALPVEEAALVASKLMEPLAKLVDGLETNAPSSELYYLLNNAVAAYLTALEELPLL